MEWLGTINNLPVEDDSLNEFNYDSTDELMASQSKAKIKVEKLTLTSKTLKQIANDLNLYSITSIQQRQSASHYSPILTHIHT